VSGVCLRVPGLRSRRSTMKTWASIPPILVVVFLCSADVASAQPAASRLEVGAQASFLSLSDFDTTNAGVGGHLSYDLAKWTAVEAEASFFPNDDVTLPPSSLAPNLRVTYARKRAAAFFGVKTGIRGDKLGLFAKARPGFTRLTAAGTPALCSGTLCPLALLVRPEYRTEFAFDLGGVLEVYPSGRTVARFELGDTMIRHRSMAPPCWQARCTSHNLSSLVGAGFRF
jgi:hypothetical protein